MIASSHIEEKKNFTSLCVKALYRVMTEEKLDIVLEKMKDLATERGEATAVGDAEGARQAAEDHPLRQCKDLNPLQATHQDDQPFHIHKAQHSIFLITVILDHEPTTTTFPS